ncbi:MAG: serine/threonine protein kinase [Deltaproteobacteria bacterium]|nr:serine/threonine protein kinase [Deltaproteobacteria bacterium]
MSCPRSEGQGDHVHVHNRLRCKAQHGRTERQDRRAHPHAHRQAPRPLMSVPPPVEALRARVAARLFARGDRDDAPASGGEHPRARAGVSVENGAHFLARSCATAPDMIARFAVLRTLGAGGMGTVYLCRDPMLARDVAVKLLHPRFDHDEQQRALAEARVLATLAHPNVVPVFEVGEFEGRTFLAMEHVDGRSLREWMRDAGEGADAASWREIVRIYLQAAAGLCAAHEADIVHRDFKPANVLVGNDGRVRVLDFGLARKTLGAFEPRAFASPDSADSPAGRAGSTLSSRSHTLAGTPAYMAPEQLRGGVVDARADQWAFCVALWEALYGVRPFQPERVREAGEHGGLPRPQGIVERGPASIRRALLRGLAARPGDRWPTLDQLVHALEAAVRQRSAQRSIALAGVACLSAAAIAGGWASIDPCERDDAGFDAVWGDAQRRELSSQLGAQLPATLHDAARWWVARLDDQREQWITAERMACRAANEHPDDELTRDAHACLLRARVGLADVVAATRDAPQRVLLRLPGADLDGDAGLGILPAPTRCLERRAGGEISSALWQELTAARALLAAANPADARLRVAQALARALTERSSTGEMLARSLAGAIDLDEGWTERAIAQLEGAVGLAETTRDDRQAAELWLLLVDAALMHLHDASKGASVLARAEAAVARLGADEALTFRLERARGVLASMRDDDASATAAFDRAEQLAIVDERRERLALDRGNHAIARGDADGARQHFEAARGLRERRLGVEHPSLDRVEIALGRAAQLAEDFATARNHFARAAALTELAYGTATPRLSSPLAGLTEALLSVGEIDEAERIAHRTAQVQAELPPPHPERGGALALLGMIAEARGHAEAAADWYLAAADAQAGLSTPALRLEAVNNAAWHLNLVGRAAEARPLYHWLEAHTDEAAQMHVFALAGVGRATHLLGDARAAIASLEAARLAASRLVDPHPQLLPEIDWHLAAALREAGLDPIRSRMLALASLQRYEADWPEQTVAIADLRMLADPPQPSAPTPAPPKPDGA